MKMWYLALQTGADANNSLEEGTDSSYRRKQVSVKQTGLVIPETGNPLICVARKESLESFRLLFTNLL